MNNDEFILVFYERMGVTEIARIHVHHPPTLYILFYSDNNVFGKGQPI